MKKIKLLMLCLLSIFCLSSCLTTGFFLGSILDEYGSSGGNNSKMSKLYYDKSKFTEYVNSLKNREKDIIEITKGVFIKVPKNIIIKKDGDIKYFYDKEKKMGIDIFVKFPFSGSSYIIENYDEDKNIIKKIKKVKILSAYGNKYIVTKIEDGYIYSNYEDTPSKKEYYDFKIDFLNNIEEVK